MKTKNLFFIIILALAAFSIAGVGAWFSVYGLTKVFPAGLLTYILFGALEFAKIVIVSFIYRFWKITKKLQRIYLIFATLVLMAVTSAGIYGFLTNSYQSTSNELSIINSETKVLENKKEFLVLEKTRYEDEIQSKNNQINTYISNRTAQEKLVSDLYTKSLEEDQTIYRIRAKETQDALKNIDLNINKLRDENTLIYGKISVLNDSIGSIEKQLIEIQNTDFSAEIGPLKYLSNLTGKPMDKVVNWLALLIILVFDPLAIILIISLNQLVVHSGWEPFAATKSYKKLKEQEEKEKEEQREEEQERRQQERRQQERQPDLSELLNYLKEKDSNKKDSEILELLNYLKTKDEQEKQFKESINEKISELTEKLNSSNDEEFKNSMKEQIRILEDKLQNQTPTEVVKEVIKEVPVIKEIIKEIEVEHPDIQRVTTNINKSTFIPNK